MSHTIRPRRQRLPYLLGLALLVLGLRHFSDEILGTTKTWIVLVAVGALCLAGGELLYWLAHLTISRDEIVSRSAYTRSVAIRDIAELLSESESTIRFGTRFGREFVVDLSMFDDEQRSFARLLLRNEVAAYADAV